MVGHSLSVYLSSRYIPVALHRAVLLLFNMAGQGTDFKLLVISSERIKLEASFLNLNDNAALSSTSAQNSYSGLLKAFFHDHKWKDIPSYLYASAVVYMFRYVWVLQPYQHMRWDSQMSEHTITRLSVRNTHAIEAGPTKHPGHHSQAQSRCSCSPRPSFKGIHSIGKYL